MILRYDIFVPNWTLCATDSREFHRSVMRKPFSSSGRRSTRATGLAGVFPDPGFIEFCDPTLRGEPPSGNQWLYEIKGDGYRAQVHLQDKSVTVYSRSGYDWTDRFPTVAKAALKLRACQVVLDGEAVVMGKNGIPDFQALRRELSRKGSNRTVYLADSKRVRLYDRLGHDLTQRFPLIVKAMAYLPSCTIDGEAVACDDSGVPSFDVIRRRQGDHRAFLYAFDLIELTGADRRRDPLEHRKFDLSQLLADASPWLVLNNWIDGDKFDGTAVFEYVCSLGLEGIVSKRKDSRYISGRSPYWLKMKNPGSEAVRREAEDEFARQSVSWLQK
jgi:ATP-dependent DNA ligase